MHPSPGQPADHPEPTRQRVYVHIGAPKTGTTYLQNVLWANRDLLATRGALYPYTYPTEHFDAMLDVRQMPWGGRPAGQHPGAWDAVAGRVRRWQGELSVVSNELLAGASRETIERIVESVQPADVHVIYTARDFARQLVSDWQEHIKHRHQITLEDFVAELRELGLHAQRPFGELFWSLHDAAHVLPRWASVVSPQQVHLVTVPQSGAPGNTLLERFCDVTRLESDRLSLDGDRANTSLGLAEAELLRRVNGRLAGVPERTYDHVVRQELTEVLGGRSATAVLPARHTDWVLARSEAMVDAVAGQGYDIVGDLAELLPSQERARPYLPSTEVSAGALVAAAVDAVAHLLRHIADQERTIRDLRRQLDERG